MPGQAGGGFFSDGCDGATRCPAGCRGPIRCQFGGDDPRCHIAAEEDGAFRLLHGLSATALTVEARQPTLTDFHALEQPVGSLVIELPLRRVAFALPSWDELRALTNAARESGVWIHLDGARLWECTPFYRRSAAQIAALADSVYVSLYKGLGGIAGAMLAGSEAFIREARLWRLRQGGVLRSVFPLVEAGRRGLEKHLPRMTTYVENAAAVASALREIPGVDTAPITPAINAFQVHFPFPRSHLEKAHLSFAAACGAWLFDSFRDSDAGRSHADVTIGDAVEHWGLARAVGAVAAFLANVNS